MNTEIEKLQLAVSRIMMQLRQLLNDIDEREYSNASEILLNASIGQHVRHIIELFVELNNGYESGKVNYEMRQRDIAIETKKAVALSKLAEIENAVSKDNKPLLLETGFTEEADRYVLIESSYFRELAYNIEHSIHHMALIRVALTAMPAVKVEEQFGVAYATIKYRKSCAQ